MKVPDTRVPVEEELMLIPDTKLLLDDIDEYLIVLLSCLIESVTNLFRSQGDPLKAVDSRLEKVDIFEFPLL